MRKWKIILVIFSLAVYGGCAGGGSYRLPSPAAISGAGGKDMKALAEGRSLFVKECATCHRLFRPGELTPDKWRETLPRHRGRVPLTKAQFDNIEDYVTRASAFLQTGGATR